MEPRLGTAALVLGGLLLLVVVVADALLSPGYVRRVRDRVAAGDRTARTAMYRLTLLLAWPAAALAAGVLLAGGTGLSGTGLRLPDDGALTRYAPALTGAAAGLLAVAVVMAVRSRRGAAGSGSVLGDVDVLLPRTPSERRWFAAVAVTAGVTEEVFYRALALTVLLAVLPGGRWPALVVAALAFGLGHAYQGAVGVVGTAVAALGLGLLYLDTGSLLPGMVLHALVDLRVLLVRPAPDPAPGRSSTAPRSVGDAVLDEPIEPC